MEKPAWFILLEQWVKNGRGEIGPTLPFIVGAIAYKNGQNSLLIAVIANVHPHVTPLLSNGSAKRRQSRKNGQRLKQGKPMLRLPLHTKNRRKKPMFL